MTELRDPRGRERTSYRSVVPADAPLGVLRSPAGLLVTAPTVDARTSAARVRERLRADHGLVRQPPAIPPKWFYEEEGSLLFEQLTELPECSPSRTEEALLTAHAGMRARG